MRLISRTFVALLLLVGVGIFGVGQAGAAQDAATPIAGDAPVSGAEAQVSSGSFTVAMTDGGEVPGGLTWSLMVSGSWDPIQTGSVPEGPSPVSVAIPNPVEYGTYQLWITGAGYSSGQVIVVDAPTFSHGFALDRLSGELTVTVTTSNGADLPAGTTWSLEFASFSAGAAIAGPQSGTLATALPSGGTLPITNPVENGTYTLTINAPGFLPYSGTINHTDVWNPDTAFTAELEALTSEVSLGVSMSDSGPIPAGLTWTLFPGGSWEPMQTGPVTAGGTSFSATLPDPVPYGTYQLWITGAGYSSGQVIVVGSETTHHDFVLDRLSGDVTVTVTTSNGADIPAGTTWSLDVAEVSGSAVNGAQSGTLATPLASGSTLPISNPVEYGTYTLTIDAPGFAPFSTTVNHTDPWNPDTAVTAELEFLESEVSLGVSMSDDGPIPAGLTWTLFPAGSWTPIESGPVTAGVLSFEATLENKVPYGTYQLWITGNGYSSGQVIVVDAPTFHHDFVLDRLIGSITVNITTSDGGDIPAGTTWALVNSDLVPVSEGTLADALPSGSQLLSVDDLEYGQYLFEIHAPGYEQLAVTIEHTDPWNADTVVTYELVLIPTPTPTGTVTIEPTATATSVPTTPAPTATAKATGTPHVASLPKTGQGESGPGMGAAAMLLMLALGTALVAGGLRMRASRRS